MAPKEIKNSLILNVKSFEILQIVKSFFDDLYQAKMNYSKELNKIHDNYHKKMDCFFPSEYITSNYSISNLWSTLMQEVDYESKVYLFLIISIFPSTVEYKKTSYNREKTVGLKCLSRILLVELVQNVPPYSKKSYDECYDLIISNEPIPVNEHLFSLNLLNLIYQCLRKEASDRIHICEIQNHAYLKSSNFDQYTNFMLQFNHTINIKK
ncbi:hypothetical protein A3Q56_00092 [Intoshia linei]|uniref:Protein kinase domain-containing protein n=1 Tax=Intoshia linei TaxID=1819745 RepID=A0A177BF02_9BILA|nr:hypothetical protein A3Q56_00092 [Intoshia linei]